MVFKGFQNAVEKVLTDYTWLDRQNVFCLGGSHGGFLVTHLIGQFPVSHKDQFHYFSFYFHLFVY